MSEVFIMLNNKVAPFDDLDARRALVFATDKKVIIGQLQAGLFEPANGPHAPGSPYSAESGYGPGPLHGSAPAVPGVAPSLIPVSSVRRRR